MKWRGNLDLEGRYSAVGAIHYNEQSASPAAAAGIIKVYSKTDNKLYMRTPDGIETELGTGGGGGSGVATISDVTKAGIAVGQAVLADGTTAQADSSANAEAVGIVESISGSVGSVVTNGFITLASGTWPESATLGDALYLSAATAGLLTKVAPTTNGQIEKPIVICASTTTGFVVAMRGSIVSSSTSGGGVALGTPVAATSGTSIDFISIPSGTKRVTINLKEVSVSATTNYLIQIGDSGGVETSMYVGSSVAVIGASGSLNGAGFIINPDSNLGANYSGTIILTLENATTNTWALVSNLSHNISAQMFVSAGSKSLSAELDRVRITTAGGTATFDNGEINITYE